MRADVSGAACIRAEPGKARLMDADHLFSGKWSPGVAKVGAHLAALTQPHGVRNRCFAYRTPGKGLDDRRNRGRRRFGHARVFETGDIASSACGTRPPSAGEPAADFPRQQAAKPSDPTSCLRSWACRHRTGRVSACALNGRIFRARLDSGALHCTERKLLAPCRLRPSLPPMLACLRFQSRSSRSIRPVPAEALPDLHDGGITCVGATREPELAAHLQHRLVLAHDLADELRRCHVAGQFR